MSSSVDHIVNYILSHLGSEQRKSPLFVAVQGPQGSGKSFCSALTKSVLSSPPHSLKVVALSLDDLYKAHDGLVQLRESHPDNPLWTGRGQPGTHDISLGIELLEALKSSDGKQVEIPQFDKSLFDGEGDRLPMSGNAVNTPVDVVILEGWCTGFYPISADELDKRWNGIWQEQKSALGLSDAMVGSKTCIEDVNRALCDYRALWSHFNLFVQLYPEAPPNAISLYSVIYKWRLQQEHNMKALNGGRGMTDDAVKVFVDRYIPGYIFFGDGVIVGDVDGAAPPWAGQTLRICIDESRDVVNIVQM